MDDKLRHLKESMDRTVLRNGTFRADEKRNILLAIREQKQIQRRRKLRLRAGFSIAVGFCLILGLAWIGLTHMHNQPKGIASKAAPETIMGQKSSSNRNQQTEVDKNVSADQVTPKIKTYVYEDKKAPDYTYVIFNHYYYKETGETVTKEELGQEIGRVKRMGVWSDQRSGDSNEIPPGAIYAIHGKDPAIFIAAKGPMMQDGKMQSGYLIFRKSEPVNRN